MSASRWPGILQRTFKYPRSELDGAGRDGNDGGGRGGQGGNGSNTNPPPIKLDRDNRAAISRVAGVRGRRTQTDRLMGAAHDAVSEEAAMLVKDRTRLKVEAEVGRFRNKTIYWGMGEDRIFLRTGH